MTLWSIYFFSNINGHVPDNSNKASKTSVEQKNEMGILALQAPARSKSQYQGLKAQEKWRITMHIKQSALTNNLMF